MAGTRLNDAQRELLSGCYSRLYERNRRFRTLVDELYHDSLTLDKEHVDKDTAIEKSKHVASISNLDSCRAVLSSVRWHISVSTGSACRSTWMTRRYRSTRTTLSAFCGSSRWVKRTGCSAGPSWAQNTSALCKACWRPAAHTASIPTITSWTCGSVSVSAQRHWCISLRLGFGKRCLPPIRNGRTCATLVADMLTPPRERLRLDGFNTGEGTQSVDRVRGDFHR